MSSFDNSLYSNAINEAVSRQNATAKAEETLEKIKVGGINTKDTIKMITEGKWSQAGDMIGQGSIDAGLRGHGFQFYSKMISQKVGKGIRNKLMKSKLGKLGQRALGELNKEDLEEIQKSAEKGGISAGAKTFMKQRFKKGAKSFVDKFKKHYDKTFNSDDPEWDDGGGDMEGGAAEEGSAPRVGLSLKELHAKYSYDVRGRSLGQEEGGADDMSSHQQTIDDLSPPEHVQDEHNYGAAASKQQEPEEDGSAGGRQQEPEEDGSAGGQPQEALKEASANVSEQNAKLQSASDAKTAAAEKYSSNPKVEQEGENMEKDIDGNNENMEMGEGGEEDPLGGLGAIIGDVAILAVGAGIMGITSLFTGNAQKKEEEQAEKDREAAVKQAQTQALSNVPSISTQYGV